ncbi:MAG: 4-alpha-glucanotransferase [Sulfuriferula sp.]
MSAAVQIRQAGVLLHPTSLPSRCLDEDAYRWLDWLAAAGVGVWQMMPLGVPLAGVSPYQCASAFALNPALFPARLPAVDAEDLAFQTWLHQQRHWVENFALFMVLKKLYTGASWVDWSVALRQRDVLALQSVKQQYQHQIDAYIQQQYQLYVYWQHLRHYATERKIALFGDMPIFVAHDSADVWANPHCFLLDDAGQATLVAGVPPDYFSATGQHWGNPQYNWEYMSQSDFIWWRERLRYHFEFFDLVRIDHFRGLAASWMIPAASPTAMDGYWQDVPGAALLQCILEDMGNVPLVAEDLGVITPDVDALRKQFHLPGMSVLQFAFDSYEDNPHKPQNVTPDRVYYTGTHDNDTVLGWFASLDEAQQTHVLTTLDITDAAQLNAAMLQTIFASVADLAIVPMQDLLGLDSRGRMNTPGTVDGNWLWQFNWQDVPDDLASSLHQLLHNTERLK